MWKMAKQAKWGPAVVVLLLIAQILFNGPVLISKAIGAADKISPSAYWSHCIQLAHLLATPLQNPEPVALDSCYVTLLAKYGMKLLSDISTNPVDFFTGLQQMKKQNQQPSVVQWFTHLGTTGYSSTQEKQELISVAGAVDQGKIDPKVVNGYNAAIDKPLFDQFVRQRLPTLSSRTLDWWFTDAILAIPTMTEPACKATFPQYTRSPHVDISKSSDDQKDSVYHGGRVVDGVANIYLIFWVDDAFQSASPKYVSLVTQFVQDIGQSSLYANLLQYHDALGRCPTGAKFAGTAVDNSPFPPDLVANRKDPNLRSDQKLRDAMGKLTDQVWRKEIADVTAKQHWNTQDYHNFFIILPTMSWGCGYHSYLTINGVPNVGPPGSPWAYIAYPYYNGKEQCVFLPQSPNGDHIADTATDIISHELSEGVADPQQSYKAGWDEIADKCQFLASGAIAATVDPATNGNVTWNGHHYAIQEEYSNLRHGCVLEGP